MLSKKNMALLLVVCVVALIAIFMVGNKKDTGTQETVPVAAVTKPATAEGPKTEVLQQGTGERVVKSGDYISVNYVGTLQDGTTFDSNLSKEKPFETYIGQGNVIKGWDLGLVGMKVGEKRKLTISPELGYGVEGYANVIPGNATLIFDVELIAIK